MSWQHSHLSSPAIPPPFVFGLWLSLLWLPRIFRPRPNFPSLFSPSRLLVLITNEIFLSFQLPLTTFCLLARLGHHRLRPADPSTPYFTPEAEDLL